MLILTLQRGETCNLKKLRAGYGGSLTGVGISGMIPPHGVMLGLRFILPYSLKSFTPAHTGMKLAHLYNDEVT